MINSSTPVISAWLKPIDASVKIHSGPGTDFIAIGILSHSQVANIIGKTRDADWLQISVNGIPGWVYSQTVEVDGNLETVMCVSTDTTPCDAQIPPGNMDIAVKNIRFVTGKPDLQVTFREIGREPNADLREAYVFVDEEGTEYWVDLATNQLVEFTQSQITPASSTKIMNLSQLREEAERDAIKYSTQFASIKASLNYSEGTKDNVRYFFRWENDHTTGMSLGLFQVGLDQTGRIVSYLNTLDILK